MPVKTFDRRQFLLASTALAGTAGAAAIAAGSASAHCAALHARVAEELGALVRSAAFAAGNVRSLAMDVICPCCGQPLFDFG
jgi:hypothetical protein